MHPTLVMTNSWWLASPPIDAWRLVADVAGWPRWWRAVGSVARAGTSDSDTHRKWAPALAVWRTLTEWPPRLRLRVTSVLGEPGTVIEFQLLGDLTGRATWLFTPAHSRGTEITCRWEVRAPADPRRLGGVYTRFLVERRQFSRMRECARGMGEALGCPVLPLREWSGALRP